MSELYIGLMSGTSADGIDAALVDFSHSQPQLVATHYAPYSPHLRQSILDLCYPGPDEINRLGEMDVALGKAFAQAVNDLLQKSARKKSEIKGIGSHGQTIRHHPARQFTLQISDPNTIAALTEIPTVADFRRKDLALGGQGAPLVPAFHRAIFFNEKIQRAIANIGGIANVTLLQTDGTVLGFDTGPGNTLLDTWAETHLQKSFDQDGAWGAEGHVISDLLENLLSDPYFALSAPKSTGREYFNLAWLRQFLTAAHQAVDVQATLVELTARSIVAAIPFVQGEISICGGGVHNRLLMARLKELAVHCSVESTLQYGVDPDWVEAMAFAWLAKQTLDKRPGNLTEVTGARERSILGGVYY